MRPRIFLDTDVCIKVANEQILPADWRRVKAHIRAKYRYCVSFMTLKELLVKLSRGSEKYYEQNKNPLSVLCGTAQRQFLPFPAVWAVRRGLGLKGIERDTGVAGLSEEMWAKQVLETVLDSTSKEAMLKGIPTRLNPRRRRFFDLEHFDKHEAEPQAEHGELLQGIREDRIDRPNPSIWAAWIIKQLGAVPYTDDCDKLATALDAAYRYSESLANLADGGTYDFRRRSSDYGDVLQLFYLCDERMYFLTCDSDFVTRTKGSPQQARIILFPDLAASLRS